jgi:flavin-dependent dehydrogenase
MLRAATWDAVVVGGGPAGSAFAIEFARLGRRVALLERTHVAQHKVCGEFLSRETVELLSYLEIDVEALGATTIKQFRLVTDERRADVALPFRARALSRFRMDEALLRFAAECGVHIVRGARVETVDQVGEDGVATADDTTWRGSVVGLATGKHSLRGFSRPMGAMAGFKMHLLAPNATSLTDTVQLAFFNGGYAGACIVEEGVLSVGWVMRAALLRKIGGSWTQQADFLALQSPVLKTMLDGALPLFEKPVATAGIPYGFLRAKPIAPMIYPLGDQLAVVPSFTGDGLAIALASGIAAARAVAAGKTAERFQREMVRKLRPQFRMAAALGAMLETPALCGFTVSAAALLPRVAAQMVRATRLRGFEYFFKKSAPTSGALQEETTA